MRQHLCILLTAWLCCCLPVCAQTQADSVACPKNIASEGQTNDKPVFRPKQLIFPAAAITLGVIGTTTRLGEDVNHEVRDAMRYRSHQIKADDYLQYLPVVSVYGLSLLGAPAKHNYAERTVITATAYATMGILINAVKYTANVKRPNGADHSFPSGHTATAFMGAELVRQEYGTWYGLGAYTMATAIGVARLYNDRHWLSDVLAGAGFGVLSAKVGYWLFPYTGGLLQKITKKKEHASLVPFYTGGSGGIAFSYCF